MKVDVGTKLSVECFALGEFAIDVPENCAIILEALKLETSENFCTTPDFTETTGMILLGINYCNAAASFQWKLSMS